MKRFLKKKPKKINLVQNTMINEPLKILKKIDIKKLTSFSLNKTFDNFKERIKKAEIE